MSSPETPVTISYLITPPSSSNTDAASFYCDYSPITDPATDYCKVYCSEIVKNSGIVKNSEICKTIQNINDIDAQRRQQQQPMTTTVYPSSSTQSSSSSSTAPTASITPLETSSHDTTDVPHDPSPAFKSKIPPAKNPKIGPIVGGVIGGIVFVSLIIGLVIFLARRKRRANTYHESVPVLDKSRASSPTSHASPVYSAPPATTTWNPSSDYNLQSGVPLQESYIPNQQQHVQEQQQGGGAPILRDPENRQSLRQSLPQPSPPQVPVELHSREVDNDGISINSFDMNRPSEQEVPRLPVYQRGSSGA
ncbi:hypothetical protein BZA77DRAFT_309613 [Pyronema omphalodes]|nr:hypothetical protein BZA77DRAFT_309613 [Pyronema omphalodes]